MWIDDLLGNINTSILCWICTSFWFYLYTFISLRLFMLSWVCCSEYLKMVLILFILFWFCLHCSEILNIFYFHWKYQILKTLKGANYINGVIHKGPKQLITYLSINNGLWLQQRCERIFTADSGPYDALSSHLNECWNSELQMVLIISVIS